MLTRLVLSRGVECVPAGCARLALIRSLSSSPSPSPSPSPSTSSPSSKASVKLNVESAGAANNQLPTFTPTKYTISPFIAALSKHYKTSPQGIKRKFVTLVRELSEFGDTVGVLDAHRAIIRRSIPLHFDMFQIMLHHFARINDFKECKRLLREAVAIVEGGSATVVNGAAHKPNGSIGASIVAMHPSKMPRNMLYNALLLALVENQQWEKFDGLLEEMQKEQVSWDEATYLLVARMRLQSGHADRMKEVIAHARENGFQLTSAVYSYVLQHTKEETDTKEITQEMAAKHIDVQDVSQHVLLNPENIAHTPSTSTTHIQQAAPSLTQSPLSADIPQTPVTDSNPLSPSPPFSASSQYQQPIPHTILPDQLPEQQLMQSQLPLYPPQFAYPPPPYPIYEYTPPTPLVDDRILLQFPSDHKPSTTNQRALEEYHKSLETATQRSARQSVLKSMISSGVIPDKTTISLLMSTYKGQEWDRACQVWKDFAQISRTKLAQSLLLPLIVPTNPNWRHVLACFKNNSVRSLVAFDRLLTAMVKPGEVQEVKDLLVTIMKAGVAPSKEALVTVLCGVMGENVQDLENLLSWLLEHGAVFDQQVYRSLASSIYSSSCSPKVKRDAILSLHRTMKQRRVLPDYTFFSVAFQSLMACDDCEPIAPLLLSMKSSGVRVDQPLYSLLTVFLLRNGEVALAEQVDEDMRFGATDLQVASHYGYLRAYQDRGELSGAKSNCVVSALDIYYQQSFPSPFSLSRHPNTPTTIPPELLSDSTNSQAPTSETLQQPTTPPTATSKRTRRRNRGTNRNKVPANTTSTSTLPPARNSPNNTETQ